MDSQKCRGVCVPGFKAAGLKDGKYGVMLIVADRLCAAAGVFTGNSVKAGPVLVSGKLVPGVLRAVVANSGNANCCVDSQVKDARSMASYAAKVLGVESSSVGVCSTGIIGKPIDLKKLFSLVDRVAPSLSSSSAASLAAAKAIMTTDTVPKQAHAEYGGIQVGGIVKGAGMIAPNMATMLAFITTNADFPPIILQRCLKESVEKSFNMIAVDGDMSTNDTVLLLSNRTKKGTTIDLQKALDEVTTSLAKQIARDGEGATKFIEVNVTGAKNKDAAKKAAHAIIRSPLVKTALYGENPNWGRILASAGAATKINYIQTTVAFEGGGKKAFVFRRGRSLPLESAHQILKNHDIIVHFDIGAGKEEAKAWTCDLSPQYVKINAEYS
ncbi:Glutamate N-acetyltransferase [uncultured archaeon]|nr:Glutamate N-acetyltransferase [uncultured archaeon]